MRILALDVGEKNIGLALSDELGWTAQGLGVIRCKTDQGSIEAISNIVKENGVTEIVVGMPVNLDGGLGRQAQGVAEFMEHLKQKISLPIKAWDERLTSLQAEKIMLQADLSRRKRKRKIDQVAAQLILQSYLDANSNK